MSAPLNEGMKKLLPYVQAKLGLSFGAGKNDGSREQCPADALRIEQFTTLWAKNIRSLAGQDEFVNVVRNEFTKDGEDQIEEALQFKLGLWNPSDKGPAVLESGWKNVQDWVAADLPKRAEQAERGLKLVMAPPGTSGPTPAPTPAPAPQWKYNPPPPNEPEPHDEHFSQSGKSPEGISIVGARVRGKKHKHEGTHCDDWFEFRTSGKWTILAVADGGGSYRFSRVGSKAAARAAVNSLAQDLESHVIKPRPTLNMDVVQDPDFARVTGALQTAMAEACAAVQTCCSECLDDPEYRRILKRAPMLQDFQTTLLLAVHTTVLRESDGAEYSVVHGCAVGDGMIALLDRNGATHLLMAPDSGAHSGEVRFLSKEEITPSRLQPRIRRILAPLEALMVMTDGVADDYFPNDQRMSWLFGDLVLNGIIANSRSTRSDSPPLSVDPSGFETEVETLEEKPRRVVLRSLSAYADQLERTPEQVLASRDLLWSGSQAAPLCVESDPAARLKTWLDAYTVRGSFDDRTLVVMHRE
jgi:serine/threonine protein phosphatase PrpC